MSVVQAELKSIECMEIQLIIEAVFLKTGYDFRGYATAHVKRRILRRLELEQLPSLLDMQRMILYETGFVEKLLFDLSISVTEMFRDPPFYRVIREQIVPILKTYPFPKVWLAGCATGEEVYSLAILLYEEGLLERTQIYATDFNNTALQTAREGIYPLERMQEYTLNYQKSGGSKSFSDYYTARYDAAIIEQSLKKNLVFADHNLVTDRGFGEMNLIMCRNVLIYFAHELQNRVLSLLSESLCRDGILCLGAKESLYLTDYVEKFERLADEHKIFRKRQGKPTNTIASQHVP